MPVADSDDWRVTVSVSPAQQSDSLRQVEDDIRRQVSRGIAVSVADGQIFDDPAGDHDWGISAVVDLGASDEAGSAVLRIADAGQL